MINLSDKIKPGMSIGMQGESHNFLNGGQIASKKAALNTKKSTTNKSIN